TDDHRRLSPNAPLAEERSRPGHGHVHSIVIQARYLVLDNDRAQDYPTRYVSLFIYGQYHFDTEEARESRSRGSLRHGAMAIAKPSPQIRQDVQDMVQIMQRAASIRALVTPAPGG